MSGLVINQEKLNKAFTVNDFRAMVNYESGKNKGDVRLVKTKDGFALEKFNNQVDIGYALRERTGVAESKALRQAFVAALRKGTGDDLSAAAFDHIVRELMLEDGKYKSTPLTRREIRNVLVRYDAEMNTAFNRRARLTTLLQQTCESMLDKLCVKDEGDKAAYRKIFEAEMRVEGNNETEEYFREEKVDSDWETKQNEKVKIKNDNLLAYDVGGAVKTRPMVKSDVEFVALLATVKIRAEALTQKLLNERLVERLINDGGTFGADGKTKVWEAVKYAVKSAGLDPEMGIDSSIGSKGSVRSAFRDKVLPVLIEEARLQAKENADSGKGEKSPGKILTMDKISQAAQEFFQQVSEWVKDAEARKVVEAQLAAEVQQGGKAQEADAPQQGGKAGMLDAVKNAGKQVFAMNVNEKFLTTVNVDGSYIITMREELEKAYDLCANDEKLQKMADLFVKDRCPLVAASDDAKLELVPKTQAQLAEELSDKAVLAAKLMRGEKWKNGLVGPNGKPLYDYGTSAAEFVAKADELVQDVANKEKLGKEAGSAIAEARLPVIVNARIQTALAKGVKEQVHLGAADVESLTDEFKAMAKLYKNYDQTGLARLMKAREDFEKELKADIKKGLLMPSEASYIYTKKFQPALIAELKQQRQSFLSSLPSYNPKNQTVDDYVNSHAKECENRADGAVNVAKAEANRYRIAYMLQKKPNTVPEQDQKTLQGYEAVTSYVAEHKDINSEKLIPALQRLYDRIALKVLPDMRVKDGKKVLETVNGQFVKQANDLLGKYKDFRQAQVEYARTKTIEALNDFDEKFKAKYRTLTEKERTAFTEALVNEALALVSDKIDLAIRDFLNNPEAYTSAKQLHEQVLAGVLSNETGGMLAALGTVLGKWADRTSQALGNTDKNANAFFNTCKFDAGTRLHEGGRGKEIGLNWSAVGAYVDSVIKGVRERVIGMPAYYGLKAPNAEALKNEVTNEIAAAVQGPFKTFVQEYEKFLKQAAKYEKDYKSFTAEHFKEVRDNMVCEVAELAQKNPGVVKASYMTALYAQRLKEAVEAKAGDAKLAADVYLSKIKDAMQTAEICKKAFREKFLETGKDLPEAVRDHFEKVVFPQYVDNLHTRVCMSPSDFIADEGEDPKQKTLSLKDDAETNAEELAKEALSADYTRPENDKAILEAANIRTNGKSEEVLKRVGENLRIYAGAHADPATKAALMNARIDQMFLQNILRREGDLPADVLTTLEEFAADIRSIVLPVFGEFDVATVCSDKNYDRALTCFRTWLDAYDKSHPLPTLEYQGMTIREHADNLFLAKWAEIQHDLANSKIKRMTPENLNAEFLLSLSQMLGQIGVQLAVQEAIHDMTCEQLYSYLGEECPQWYDLGSLGGKGPNDSRLDGLRQAVEINRNELQEHFTRATKLAAKNVEEMHITSYQGFARCREDVKNLFRTAFKTNFNAVNDKCRTRYGVEQRMLEVREAKLQQLNVVLETGILKMKTAMQKKNVTLTPEAEVAFRKGLVFPFAKYLTNNEEIVRRDFEGVEKTNLKVRWHEYLQSYEKDAVSAYFYILEMKKKDELNDNIRLFLDYRECFNIETK